MNARATRKRKQQRRQRGFTLIDMAAVLVILATLTQGYLHWQRDQNEKRVVVRTVDGLREIEEAVYAHRLDRGVWTADISQLAPFLPNLQNIDPVARTAGANGAGLPYRLRLTPGGGVVIETDLLDATQARAVAAAFPNAGTFDSTTFTVTKGVPIPGLESSHDPLLPRDGSRPMTGGLDMGGQNILAAGMLNVRRVLASEGIDSPLFGARPTPTSRSTAFGGLDAVTGNINILTTQQMYANVARVNTRVFAQRFVDGSNNGFYVEPGVYSRVNQLDAIRLRTEADSVAGATGCTTKEIGTTASGELLSCVNSRWQRSGGSRVALREGKAKNGAMVQPIVGYTSDQCNLSVSGVPEKADGGYKRSRHFSHYAVKSGSGWRVHAAFRTINHGTLTYVADADVDWQMVCADG